MTRFDNLYTVLPTLTKADLLFRNFRYMLKKAFIFLSLTNGGIMSKFIVGNSESQKGNYGPKIVFLKKTGVGIIFAGTKVGTGMVQNNM